MDEAVERFANYRMRQVFTDADRIKLSAAQATATNLAQKKSEFQREAREHLTAAVKNTIGDDRIDELVDLLIANAELFALVLEPFA